MTVLFLATAASRSMLSEKATSMMRCTLVGARAGIVAEHGARLRDQPEVVVRVPRQRQGRLAARRGGGRGPVRCAEALDLGQKRNRVRPPGSVAETTVAERGSMR
jgi:hypothetical protein